MYLHHINHTHDDRTGDRLSFYFSNEQGGEPEHELHIQAEQHMNGYLFAKHLLTSAEDMFRGLVEKAAGITVDIPVE